jgi:Na+-driven multidrug efflux pump
MKTTDTALLGHLSHNGNKSYYLSVSSFADLWMSTTSVMLQGQVLGILAPPCIESGRPELVGVWLQISYTCLSLICVPVVICFLGTEKLLLACGVAADMAHDAQYYANVFIAALPARILASQLVQYLNCQKVLLPSTIAASIGMLFNLGFGLYFV